MNSTAQRSQQLLKGSLLSLMEERDLDAISVGEICNRAQLTRPTFYNHFPTKEALAATIVDDLLAEFSLCISEEQIKSTQGIIHAFLCFWENRWDTLQILVRSDMLPLVNTRFQPHLESIYERSPFTDKSRDYGELAYHNAFLAAGTVGMLALWARSTPHPSAEEVAVYMEHMIASAGAGLERG